MISLRTETPKQSTTFFSPMKELRVLQVKILAFTTESPSTCLMLPQFYSICCSQTTELEVVFLAF